MPIVVKVNIAGWFIDVPIFLFVPRGPESPTRLLNIEPKGTIKVWSNVGELISIHTSIIEVVFNLDEVSTNFVVHTGLHLLRFNRKHQWSQVNMEKAPLRELFKKPENTASSSCL